MRAGRGGRVDELLISIYRPHGPKSTKSRASGPDGMAVAPSPRGTGAVPLGGDHARAGDQEHHRRGRSRRGLRGLVELRELPPLHEEHQIGREAAGWLDALGDGRPAGQKRRMGCRNDDVRARQAHRMAQPRRQHDQDERPGHVRRAGQWPDAGQPTIQWVVPARKGGATLAGLVTDPEKRVEEDLYRFKTYVEGRKAMA